MKLQAVTICINYADYLECTLDNRRHFDRWIIITNSKDRETHQLCAKYAIECYDSESLAVDSNAFHAATSKGQFLNKALDLLDSNGWAVVIDADILLPRHFRQRIESIALEEGCIYGMAGRKICRSRTAFELTRACEPWDRFVGRNTQPLGYFNLFSLQTSPNRYPIRELGDGVDHDDWLFTNSFLVSKRRILPMTVIHVGLIATNWDGRKTGRFILNEEISQEGLSEGFISLLQNGSNKAAVVLGYFPGGRWREIAALCGKVYLIDQFQIHTKSGSHLVERDRVALRKLCIIDNGNEPLLSLGPNSVSTINKIADNSIDLLYLAGEIGAQWLIKAFPYLRKKLKDDSIVCGDLYGLPHWPEATYAISLILGVPDVVVGNFWWKSSSAEEHNLPIARRIRNVSERGVVFVNLGNSCIVELLISLYATRIYWKGAIEVFHWGDEEVSLQIVCAKLGVEIRSIGYFGEYETAQANLEKAIQEAQLSSKFNSNLILFPGMFPVSELKDVFELPANCQFQIVDQGLAIPHLYSRASKTVQSVAWKSATAYNDSNDCCLLVYGNKVEEWTGTARRLWRQHECDLALQNAVKIKVDASISIVSIVTQEEALTFQDAWVSWRFPVETRIYLILVGLSRSELTLPKLNENVTITEVPADYLNNVSGLLQNLSLLCETESLLILPSVASALPGATIWPGLNNDNSTVAVHAGSAADNEKSVTGNYFLPTSFFGLFPAKLLREFALLEENVFHYDQFPVVLHMLIDKFATDVIETDMREAGWDFPDTHILWKLSKSDSLYTQSLALSSPKEHPFQIKTRHGLRQLADDVVVISLPERMDRRLRVMEMMERERVAYRFTDGIRVNPHDIRPEEISEVGWHDFKLVAGRERYISGMIGCKRAHIFCFEQAVRYGLKSVLIMEDDVELLDGWYDRYESAKAELPFGWLQLYLSAGNFRSPTKFSNHLYRLHGACQTTAILYSEEGIRAGLACARSARSEIDWWMGLHLHPFGCSYCVHPKISRQSGGFSDILSYSKDITD